MRTWSSKLVALGLGAMMMAGAPAQFQKTIVRDFGTLSGVQEIVPRNINRFGEVVGSLKYDRAESAFFYNGTLRDIGQLPGRGFAVARGINSSRQIVGHSGLQSLKRGFTWQNDVMTETPFFSAVPNEIVDINETGVSVFNADNSAFIRTAVGGPRRLPTLSANTVYQEAAAINNQGFIFGWEIWLDGTRHFFTYDPEADSVTEQNLLLTGDTVPIPTDIVDVNGLADDEDFLLVGNSASPRTDSFGNTQLFTTGFVDTTVFGTAYAVPLAGDNVTFLHASNNTDNSAVGRSGRFVTLNGRITIRWTGCQFFPVLDPFTSTAFMVPVDANTLVPPSVNFRITDVVAMNDRLQTVARYDRNGVNGAALLTPVTTPQSLLVQTSPNGLIWTDQNVLYGGDPILTRGAVAMDGTVQSPTPINVRSSNGVVRVPATVTLQPGQTTFTFPITTTPVATTQSVNLTVERSGYSVTKAIQVLPPTLNRLIVQAWDGSTANDDRTGGLPVDGRVEILGAALPAGMTVALTSNNVALARVPASVRVLANTSSVNFRVTTSPVTVRTRVLITATVNGISKTDGVNLVPPFLESLSLNRSEVLGGLSVTGTVFLTGPALSPGSTVTLRSNTPAVAQVPASVFLATGARSATFTVTTVPVTIATPVDISARLGAVTIAKRLTVRTPLLNNLVILLPTTVEGGRNLRAYVQLDARAPAGGIVVNLSSSLGRGASVPATVTVPEGENRREFQIQTFPIENTTDITIVASQLTATRQATLRNLAADLQNFQALLLDADDVIEPADNEINPGEIVTLRATLSRPAQAGGATVFLFTSDPTQFPVPVGIFIPEGQTVGQARVVAGNANTYTVTARRGTTVFNRDVVVVTP